MGNKSGTQFTGYDNTCHCMIRRDGRPLGKCLRCFDMSMEYYQKGYLKGKRDLLKEIEKMPDEELEKIKP